MKVFLISVLLTIIAIVPFLLVFIVGAQDSTPALIITEVMPNPVGDDAKYEWIEIQNVSSSVQNLKDWTLNTKPIPETVVDPGEIIILARDIPGFQSVFPVTVRIRKVDFNLVNTGGTVKLENTIDGEYHHFEYPQSSEGKSIELLEGECGTIVSNSRGHTAGQINTSCITPTLPASTVIPTVIYHTTDNTSGKVIINTVSPNPVTDDEWLELKNVDTVTLNLAAWKITDESNKAFTIDSLTLSPGQVERIFPKTVSLNNDGDLISLYDSKGKLIDTLNYPKSAKGQLFGRDTSNNTASINEEDNETKNSNESEDNKNSIQQSGSVLSSQSTTNTNYNKYFKKPMYYKFEDYVR